MSKEGDGMEIGITFTKEELAEMASKAVEKQVEDTARMYVLEHMRTYSFREEAKPLFMDAVDEYMPDFLKEHKDEIVRLAAVNLLNAMKFSNKEVLTALLAVGEGRDK